MRGLNLLKKDFNDPRHDKLAQKAALKIISHPQPLQSQGRKAVGPPERNNLVI